MQHLEAVKTRYGFAQGAGYVDTVLPQVQFFWSTETVPRAPLIYNAGIVLILQGHKIGYLGEHVFEYNPDHYLVVSLPTPFDCATFATETDPMLGLFINIDAADLRALAPLVAAETGRDKVASLGLSPAPADADLKGAVDRLLKALCSEAESQALGQGIVREILFHALKGPHGGALQALAQSDSHYDRVARSITRIRESYAENLNVDALAETAGMSAPVFYRAFKSITGSSPLQYLKATRLSRAQGLLLEGKIGVAEAARRVGYENAAHFSREFKKHFQVSPKEAQGAGYHPIDL
ncbi:MULTISPECIES: AraC family transcriptional regulator [unclassified Shimia]|uniref:AraC family transcriptional regulator n=1 Tax=unclassified Shimia TaxID=2630038 RepID=UPI001AD998F9|nr:MULTISPECIES: AraC family transcriptional regulator [unclassified Shimia]MBO9473974.1 AraC family transcriptional regulator [Shimia sp. R10_1]MDA5557644.1 AraC family transcriptional regulator [Shimia sp. MMG029]